MHPLIASHRSPDNVPHRPLQRPTAPVLRAPAAVQAAALIASIRRVLDDNAEFRGLAAPASFQRQVRLHMLGSMGRLRRALAEAAAGLPDGAEAEELEAFLWRWPPGALGRAALAAAHSTPLDHHLVRLAHHFPPAPRRAANDSVWAAFSSLFRRSRSEG